MAIAGDAPGGSRGGGSTIGGAGDLIGNVVGHGNDRRSRPEMARFRQTAAEDLFFGHRFVTIFEQPFALLRQFVLTEKTAAATDRDRPAAQAIKGQGSVANGAIA